MGNYLLLKESNKHKWHIAVRFADGYRMIPVNESLDEAAEERAKQPDCTPEELTAMGLKYLFLPFSIVKSVAYNAVQGGAVILQTKDKRYTYEIDDIDDKFDKEWLDSFFEGVQRNALPKRKQTVKKDWREGKQKQPMLDRASGIGVAVNIVCIGSWFFGSILHSILPWLPAFVVPLAGLLTAIALCLSLPEYFTPVDNKTRKNAGCTTHASSLMYALMLAALGLALTFFGDFEVLDYLPLVGMSLVATLVFVVLMYKFCKDVGEHTEISLIVLLVCGFFAFMGIFGQLNHYADIGRESQSCTVTELRYQPHAARGSNEKHYCTIKAPNGKTVELEVSKGFYQSVGKGDKVRGFVGTGALGIEYAYIEE